MSNILWCIRYKIGRAVRFRHTVDDGRCDQSPSDMVVHRYPHRRCGHDTLYQIPDREQSLPARYEPVQDLDLQRFVYRYVHELCSIIFDILLLSPVSAEHRSAHVLGGRSSDDNPACHPVHLYTILREDDR